MPDAPELIHGSAVAHGDVAALIVGPSGAGKSDLALRCLLHAQSPIVPGPIRLVGDDYCEVTREGERLIVAGAQALSGKLEVRGVGIVEVSNVSRARLILVVKLVAAEMIDRMPGRDSVKTIQGVAVPVLKLSAFESSAPAKLLICLAGGGAPLASC